MNKALIGEEVTLESAPGEPLARLVLAAAAAFYEAATGALGPPAEFNDALSAALARLDPSQTRIKVRLVVETQGIAVHLMSADGGDAASVSCAT